MSRLGAKQRRGHSKRCEAVFETSGWSPVAMTKQGGLSYNYCEIKVHFACLGATKVSCVARCTVFRLWQSNKIDGAQSVFLFFNNLSGLLITGWHFKENLDS
jgi:hypothetical protein